jgi:hypothetical protein
MIRITCCTKLARGAFMSQRPNAAVELKQLARLYRIAARTPGLDLIGLQRIADRLHKKPLTELTRLELANLIGALRAIRRGLINLEVVCQPADTGCIST